MTPWSVLYTRPNKELEVAAVVSERGAEEVFLPLTRKHPRSPETPLFRCYLFARIDFQAIPLSVVNTLSGLRYVLTSGPRPQHIPEEAIQLIRSRLEDRRKSGWPLLSSLRKGDRVRIASGPLRHLEGLFEGWLDGRQRAVVLLRFMSEGSRLAVDAKHVEKVAPRLNRPGRAPRRTRGRGRRIREQAALPA